MTDYSYFYPLFKYFSDRKKFLQLSATSLNHSNIVLDKFKLFPANLGFSQYIKMHPNLSPSQKSELAEFMNLRLTGKHHVLKRYRYRDTNLKEVIKKLNYSRSKRNIFMFPNLHWDIGVSTKNSLFKDVVEWVGETLKMVKDKDEISLYLKPHPEENFSKHKGKKGVIKSVMDRGYELPSNLHILIIIYD